MTKVQLEESDAEQLLDDLRAGEGNGVNYKAPLEVHTLHSSHH